MKKISHQAGSAALFTPRRRARVISAFLAGIAGAGSSTALAQVYKWTDESGGFHYSSTPPAKTQKNATRLDSKTLEVSRAKLPPRSKNEPPEVSVTEELTAKVQNLEQQLEAERQAREAQDAQHRAAQAAFSQPQPEPAAAHNTGYIPPLPEGVSFLYTPHQRHLRHDRTAVQDTTRPAHAAQVVFRNTH